MILPFLPIVAIANAAPFEHTRIALIDEAIAVPGTSWISDEPHPGAVIGTSLWSSPRARLAHEVAAEIGGYHHGALHTALWLAPVWQGSWHPHRAFGLSIAAALAYRHTFDAGTTYRRRGGSAYEATLRPGHPGLSAQVGLGVHARLTDRIGVHLQVRGTLEGPFSPELSPVMIHRTTHLGVEYHR